MAGGYRRSRTHKGRKAFSKACRTRRRVKDLDQIHKDLSEDGKPLVFNEDLPGGGLYPCIECSRHFQNEHDLAKHKHNKQHKKRLRLLLERPYTQAEADAAGGLATQSFYQQQVEIH